MTGGVGGVGPTRGTGGGRRVGSGGRGEVGTVPASDRTSVREERRVPRSSLRIVGCPHLIPYDYTVGVPLKYL